MFVYLYALVLFIHTFFSFIFLIIFNVQIHWRKDFLALPKKCTTINAFGIQMPTFMFIHIKSIFFYSYLNVDCIFYKFTSNKNILKNKNKTIFTWNYFQTYPNKYFVPPSRERLIKRKRVFWGRMEYIGLHNPPAQL